METPEMNEKLTRVGPGTPMGNLLRRYWWPIAASAELLENPVKPISLLGEQLTLFKDRQGRLGLIAQRCAHRRLDLRYGIPESAGLRCPYHGWLYDHAGRCIEQPAEPEGSTFKERVRITAYPLEELGGLVFAYLGPQPAPLLPRWDLFVTENAIKTIAVETIPCNWLQCMENSADSVHTEYLHGHLQRYVLERQGKPADASTTNFLRHHLRTAYERHPLGIVKRRLREGQTEDTPDWKYGHLLIFPYTVRLADGGASESYQIRVPMDDERTWHICYDVFTVPGVELPKQEVIPVYRSPMADEQGRPLIDYTLGQDMVGWYAQGTIVDRSEERLGDSDRGVILFRQMLKEQMEIVERGGEPMNVFRDPAQNQMIPTTVHGGPPVRGGRQAANGGGRISMRGNYGKFNPYVEQLEAIMAQAIQAKG